ncbi:MAG: hypothetical protein EOO24_67505 [Comamonadaceae bacterium]|nr:MAG: hypothetical protein EOO24_67505 [Comamonadaceae bacterium]
MARVQADAVVQLGAGRGVVLGRQCCLAAGLDACRIDRFGNTRQQCAAAFLVERLAEHAVEQHAAQRHRFARAQQEAAAIGEGQFHLRIGLGRKHLALVHRVAVPQLPLRAIGGSGEHDALEQDHSTDDAGLHAGRLLEEGPAAHRRDRASLEE